MNTYHREVGPGFRTEPCAFVIAHQAALAHEPAKGALDHPPSRKDFESLHLSGTLDDLELQIGFALLHPIGQGLAGVSAVHLDQSQPMETAQDANQQSFGSRSLGGLAGMTIGLYALTIEDRGGGPTVLTRRRSNMSAKPGIHRLPSVIDGPLAKDVVHGFPRWTVHRQEPPGNAPLTR